MASEFFGSRGNTVKDMQRRLNALGAGLQVDGIWGSRTENAYNSLLGGGSGSRAGASANDMFQRMEYTPLTDGQMRERARDAVSGQYDAMETAERQKAESIVAALNKAIQGLDPKYASRLDSLEQFYSQSRQDISNQAIKRGMGRSSLYLQMLDKNHAQLISSKEQANADYRSELDELNMQILSTEREMQQNLGGISARRESDILKYLDTLTAQRDKTMFDMLKYNNEIAQKEAKYYADLMQQASASGSGGSSRGRSSGRRTSSTTTNYNREISNWNLLTDAGKVSYFTNNASAIRSASTKAYNEMKKEVERIRNSGKNKYGTQNTNYNYYQNVGSSIFTGGR